MRVPSDAQPPGKWSLVCVHFSRHSLLFGLPLVWCESQSEACASNSCYWSVVCRSLDSCGIRHLRIPLPDSSATVTRSEWSCRRSAGTRLAILPVQPEVEVMCETQQCAKGAASLRVRPSHDTSALCPRTVPERDPERDPARTWPSMELRRIMMAVPGSGQSPHWQRTRH